MTKKQLENMKKAFEDPTELDGYEEIRPEDQAKVIKAWQEGHVSDEDIPESARKPAGDDGEEEVEDEEKPKKKRAPAKKKAADTDGEAAEKPKKVRATKAKVKGIFYQNIPPSYTQLYRRRSLTMRAPKRPRRRRLLPKSHKPR